MTCESVNQSAFVIVLSGICARYHVLIESNMHSSCILKCKVCARLRPASAVVV